MEPSQVDIVAEYADILQIGTRNMQNYSLLRDVGRVARPVMLKRGYGATVEEWLMAAEYIVSSGNPNVILCERGIRTFETYTRNTLDLAAVPLLHHLTHLPVIVDPSHATGKRWLVRPLALGGVAVGADGVMVEVHPDPDAALSDAEQQLDLDKFRVVDGRDRAGPRAGPRPPRRSTPGRRGCGIGRRRVRRRGRTGEALITADVADGPVSAARLRGELRLPGDKSISHRALILSTLASGESRITGAGDGADVRSTAAIMRALGATVEARPDDDGRNVDYRVVSAGADGLREPDGDPRLRQLRDEPAAHRGHARRAADDRRPRRRRVVAPPSGRSYHRATASMGAVLHGRRARLPPSPHRGRAHPAAGRSITTTPVPIGAGEVGDPAGRACGPTGGRRSGNRSRRATTRSACCGRAA